MDLDARWPERGSALTWAPYGPERCCGAFRRYYGALHRASDGPEVLPSNRFVVLARGFRTPYIMKIYQELQINKIGI